VRAKARLVFVSTKRGCVGIGTTGGTLCFTLAIPGFTLGRTVVVTPAVPTVVSATVVVAVVVVVVVTVVVVFVVVVVVVVSFGILGPTLKSGK